jgi:hypothetical protein
VFLEDWVLRAAAGLQRPVRFIAKRAREVLYCHSEKVGRFTEEEDMIIHEYVGGRELRAWSIALGMLGQPMERGLRRWFVNQCYGTNKLSSHGAGWRRPEDKRALR